MGAARGARAGVALALVLGVGVVSPDTSPSGALRGLDPTKAVTQYSVDVWTTEQGLPQGTVNAIEQTPEGYLWFGTYDGLARFDGVRFTVFHKGNTDGLKDNGIRSLCLDREGALWIGTNGGGLSRLAAGQFTYHSPGEGPANDMIWALSPAPDGGVFVGTNGGTLYRVREGRFETLLASAVGESVYTILTDREGRLWVGTHGGGLKRRSADGHWTAYTTRDGLPSNFVRTLHEDRAGRLWIGTLGGGLARLAGGRFTTAGLRDGMPDDVVSDILEDLHGTLWLATRRGVVRYRDGRFSTLGRAQGLAQEAIYALHEDREGALWVGTSGAGAARLRDGTATVYTTREGLSDDFAYTASEDGEGSVWVGTALGLSRLREGTWTRYTSREGLCHDVVRSLWVAPDGDLWVGTYGGGVCRRRGGQWLRYTTREGLAHDSVRAVVGTPDGSLWVGSVGGLSRFDGHRWRTYTTADGLPTNSVICLRPDRNGDLWIGTDGGGLARYRGDYIDVYAQKATLGSNVVLALVEDDEGVLWIGSTGSLSRLRRGRLTTYTTRTGLPSDSVHQIVDDGHGHIWIGTSRGIHRFDKSAFDDVDAGRASVLTPLTLGKSDGMRSIECTAPAQPAGYRTRDGRLWFATAKGMVAFDPLRLRTAGDPPPVVVEAVLTEDRVLAAHGDIRLEAGTRRLAFQYTGLSLLAPEKVRFRYRLDGFDRDWVDAGDRRTAFYTALPPGSYRFEVTAQVGTGDWNPQPAAVALRLEPRIYQTRWFYVLGGLAIVLLAAGGHRLRVGRLESREKALALLVEERTRSLQQEKERAEEARREAERQKRIAQEADALKTEMLGIAAHDLKNPLQSILNVCELLGAIGGPVVAERSALIQRSVERMLGLIEDVLATAALEGRVGLRLVAVDLGRLAAAVCEDYQPRAAHKGQSLALAAEPGCVAWVDEGRMRDVMENLVSNALKFTPNGRSIRVRVADDDGKLRFSVEDEGPGLTEEDLQNVFGRFQRLSARPTGDETSTGLGLSIVKRLVELFRGRVWAESEGPEKGALFVVELPLWKGEPASIPGPPAL